MKLVAACPLMAVSVLCIGLFAAQPVSAADIPKEGRFDFTSCWSGASTTLSHSKSHSASSFEMTGVNRSNPPGGLFDNSSFRCVGMNHAFDKNQGFSSVCEAVDRDGDKRLTHFYSLPDGKIVREQVSGTGKYDGMVVSGNVQPPLGPFPVAKPGTFQGCNQPTGTYKMK